MSKHILDVGADTGEFANQARDHGYSSIVSLDRYHPDEYYKMDTKEELAAGKMVVADAKRLPFRDEQFDMVISINAIPAVLLRISDNKTDYRNQVKKALVEMLRVAKEGVRLGRVNFQTYEDERFSRREQIESVLEELRDSGLQVTEERVAYPDDDSPNLFLIRIQKSFANKN